MTLALAVDLSYDIISMNNERKNGLNWTLSEFKKTFVH